MRSPAPEHASGSRRAGGFPGVLPRSVTTASAEETAAAGGLLARALRPGDVVLLVGELGSGKTTFVKGVAAALGADEEVTSPTFMLCQTYRGRLTVLHADLWRLERLQEVIDLALDEEIEQGAVVLAEWGEGAAELYGDDALVVTLDVLEGAGDGEPDRLVSFAPRGPSWQGRVAPGGQPRRGREAEPRR